MNATGNLHVHERELSVPENAIDDMAEAIVNYIFELLDFIQETGGSLKTF